MSGVTTRETKNLHYMVHVYSLIQKNYHSNLTLSWICQAMCSKYPLYLKNLDGGFLVPHHSHQSPPQLSPMEHNRNRSYL